MNTILLGAGTLLSVGLMPKILAGGVGPGLSEKMVLLAILVLAVRQRIWGRRVEEVQPWAQLNLALRDLSKRKTVIGET